jgi:hypothetical protein
MNGMIGGWRAMVSMNNSTPPARDAMLLTILAQNCENARHIKNERLTFVNIYAIVVAGALSLMNSAKGRPVFELYLAFFLWVFSMIGLVSSLRLKAELEECMAKIRSIATDAGLADSIAVGLTQGRLSHLPKFRWVFPVFYIITSVGFCGLFFQLLCGFW